jgi:hypothetical protein
MEKLLTLAAMRLFFYLFLIIFLPLSLGAQNITISAKVQDDTSNEPLPFASVGIKGKSLGTVTNLQGDFDFHVPSELRNEIFVVSMLGYQNFEAPVWSLISQPLQVIKMTKSTTVLKEVVVSDSLSGGEILRIALTHITETFPMKPFLLDCFYRDIKKVGGTYISLLEAAVKIHDESYAEPRNKFKLRERVALLEVRKSLGYENRFTDYFDQGNLLEDLLLHNNVRYRQIDNHEEFFASMSRENNSYYNGHEIYVISHTKDYQLKIFIDKNDFAIVHLEYETGSSDDVVGKKKDLVSRFIGLKKVIDFKRFEGKMYLNYMTITSKINWYDLVTNELKFETELFQQLLVNEVVPNTNKEIKSTQRMRSYGLQYQGYTYSKQFWDNYNVIKDTPLDKEIISDLEKHAPLEKQFEQN